MLPIINSKKEGSSSRIKNSLEISFFEMITFKKNICGEGSGSRTFSNYSFFYFKNTLKRLLNT